MPISALEINAAGEKSIALARVAVANKLIMVGPGPNWGRKEACRGELQFVALAPP